MKIKLNECFFRGFLNCSLFQTTLGPITPINSGLSNYLSIKNPLRLGHLGDSSRLLRAYSDLEEDKSFQKFVFSFRGLD